MIMRVAIQSRPGNRFRHPGTVSLSKDRTCCKDFGPFWTVFLRYFAGLAAVAVARNLLPQTRHFIAGFSLSSSGDVRPMPAEARLGEGAPSASANFIALFRRTFGSIDLLCAMPDGDDPDRFLVNTAEKALRTGDDFPVRQIWKFRDSTS